MTRKEIIKTIFSILSDLSVEFPQDENASLQELNLPLFVALDFVISLENHFGVVLRDEDIAKCISVADLAILIEQRIEKN